MRRAAARFRQFLLGASGQLVLFIPPLALLAWSAAYASETFVTLLAPGKPVTFEFEGKGGPVTLRADSYRLELDGGLRGSLYGVTVEQKGRRVARVQRVDGRQTPFGAWQVFARGVEAEVTRLPGGRWSFEDLMPPPTDEKGPEAPFAVTLHDVAIRYRDASAGTMLEAPIRTGSARIEGKGETWVLGGTFDLPGSAKTPVKIAAVPGGVLAIDLKFNRADLSRLLPLGRRFLTAQEQRQFAPYQVKATDLTGQMRIETRGNQAPMLFGTAKGVLTGLSLGDLGSSSRADLDLSLAGTRLLGTVQSDLGQLALRARGRWDFLAKEQSAEANFTVRAPSLAAIPASLRRGLPTGYSATGIRADGVVTLQGDQWRVVGDGAADQVSVERHTLRGVVLNYGLDPQAMQARVQQASWRGAVLRGAARYVTQSGGLTAFAETVRATDLGPILAESGVKDLKATGKVQVAVTGTSTKPVFNARSQGTFRYAGAELAQPWSGLYDLTLGGTPQSIKIDRALATSTNGAVVASGTVTGKGQLSMKVRGTGLRLSAIQDQLSGQGFFAGDLTGTVQSPSFQGVAQAYRVEVQDFGVPFVQTEIGFKNNLLALRKVSADLGFSRIEADAVLDLKAGTLSGTFGSEALELADLPSEVGLVGTVAVRQGRVSGKLADPTVTAEFESGELFLGNITAMATRGSLRATSKELDLQKMLVFLSPNQNPSEADFEAAKLDDPLTVPQGAVLASGKLAWKDQNGTVRAAWQGLDLKSLIRPDERVQVAGQTSGTANVVLVAAKPTQGTGEVNLDGVTVNGSSIGAGSLAVNGTGGKWTAQGGLAQVGEEVRLLELANLEWDPQTNAAKGKVLASNLEANSLLSMLRPITKDQDAKTQQLLAEVRGEVDADLELFAEKDDWSLTVREAAIREARVGTREAGVITVRDVKRENQTWTLGNLLWKTENTVLRASGTYAENGDLSAEAELHNLDLDWLRVVDASAPVVAARVDTAQVLLSGTKDDLKAQASARIAGLQREEGTTPPSLFISDATLEKGNVTLNGFFEAIGFSGEVQGSGPLAAFTGQVKEGETRPQFQAKAQSRPRQLRDVLTDASALDASETDAQISAGAVASGNLDGWTLRGDARLVGTKVKFRDAKTTLINPFFTLTSNGKDLEVFGQATSSASGSFDFALSAPLPTTWDAPLDVILAETQIAPGASFNISQLRVEEGSLARQNLILAQADTQQPLTITGSLSRPLIKGVIDVRSLNADVPTFATEGSGPLKLPINPQFEVDVRVSQPGTIRSGPVNLVATGNSQIRGSLANPNVRAEFLLDQGVLRLPNARIELDEGGTVGLTFDSPVGAAGQVRVPVNLIGRTSKTLRRPNGNYERYDLTLNITGDLADAEGLAISGSSDPGDLTQREILAIVGQEDLIRTLAEAAGNTRGSAFSNAIYTYALPALTSGFTNELASGLGLDYIELEYNPFEGPTVAAALSLNKHFTIQGRRRIPINQYTQELFDLRLVYRPPSRNPLLSRTRFSLGTASRKPWRLAIEYSIRF